MVSSGTIWLVYVREVPPLGTAPLCGRRYPPTENVLENHRYRLTFDRDRGLITELYDKTLRRALARERSGVGVFSYQYDIYGAEEKTISGMQHFFCIKGRNRHYKL